MVVVNDIVLWAGAQHSLQKVRLGYDLVIEPDTQIMLRADPNDIDVRALTTVHARRTALYARIGSMYGSLYEPSTTTRDHLPLVGLFVFSFGPHPNTRRKVSPSAGIPGFRFAAADLSTLAE